MSKARCNGCGAMVPKSHIQTYVVGELQDYREWSMLGHTDYEFNANHHSRGEVCPFCASDGNIPLTSKVLPSINPMDALLWLLMLMAALMILVPLLTAL